MLVVPSPGGAGVVVALMPEEDSPSQNGALGDALEKRGAHTVEFAGASVRSCPCDTSPFSSVVLVGGQWSAARGQWSVVSSQWSVGRARLLASRGE